MRVCEVVEGVHNLLSHHSAKSSLDDELASVRFPRDYGVEVEQTPEGFIRLPLRERLREFHEMSHDLSLDLAGPLDRHTNTDVAGFNLYKPALGQAVRGSSEKAVFIRGRLW